MKVLTYHLTRGTWARMAFAVISFAVLEGGHGSCLAQITVREFDALTEADKRTLLVTTYLEREKLVRNLQASSVTNIYNVKYNDGKPGARLKDLSRYVCVLRRKDGNHWSKIDWFLADKLDHPNQKVITSLDSQSGIARSLAEQDTIKGVYGAIDTKEDMLIQTNRFHYWFNAKFDKPENFPISFMLLNQEAIKFERHEGDDEEIRVSLHVETNKGTPYRDTRTIWLDPKRGFMPVRMNWFWMYQSNPPLDSNMYTEIKKMDQVKGIWFPTHIIEVCTDRTSATNGFATVYETNVGPIKVGTMSDDDLKVHFDDKVQVHDRIKGVWFPASAAIQSAPQVRGTSFGFRMWLVAINVLAILGVAAIMTFRSRQRKSRDLLSK